MAGARVAGPEDDFVPDPAKPAVAFLIDRWDPQRGGAERAMAQFAAYLAAHGHRVLAVAEEHAAGAPGEHVRARSFGLWRAQRERSRARALEAAARRAGAEVTIGCRHLYRCDLYWPHGGSHAASVAARRRERGRPVGAALSGRHAQFVAFERALLEQGGARRVVCVSALVRDELADAWPACRGRLVVVENGVDLGLFGLAARASQGAALRAELGLPASTPLITFAARNPELKGLSTLLRAVRTLYESGDTSWHVLAAGDERLAETLGQVEPLAAHFSFRGHVDSLALASASDLCVLPTFRDTSGLVLLEALACGTPVITTRAAGAAVHVTPAAGTLLERPDDPQALARAIAEQLVRVRAGAVDREAVRSSVAQLDLARVHEQLERLVAHLAQEGRPAGG